MPWPEWGETDYLLTQGYAAYRDRLCPHGGHFRDECADPDTAGRWQLVVGVCQSAAAEEEWLRENKDLDPGTLVGSYLLPVGEEAVDPLIGGGFDAERAALEAEAHAAHIATL